MVARPLVVAALALLLAPRVALACSGGCGPVALKPSSAVPINAPWFVYYGSGGFSLGTVPIEDEVGALSVVDGSGKSLELTFGSVNNGVAVFRPLGLVAGEVYKVKYPYYCQGSMEVVEVALTPLPETPLPTVAGTVSGSPSQVLPTEVSTIRGSCSVTKPMAVAVLTFAPVSDLEPFLPVAKLTTYVDGTQWAEARYGEQRLRYGMRQRGPLELHAQCSPRNGHDDEGLVPGHHEGTLVVNIAGMDPLPAIPFAIDLECPKQSGCAVADAPSSGALALLLALAISCLRARMRAHSIARHS